MLTLYLLLYIFDTYRQYIESNPDALEQVMQYHLALDTSADFVEKTMQGESYQLKHSLYGIPNNVLQPTTKGVDGTFNMYGGNVEILPCMYKVY